MVIIITSFRNVKAITKRKKKAFLLLKITPDTQKKPANFWDPHFTDQRTEAGTDPEKCKRTQSTYYLYK